MNTIIDLEMLKAVALRHKCYWIDDILLNQKQLWIQKKPSATKEEMILFWKDLLIVYKVLFTNTCYEIKTKIYSTPFYIKNIPECTVKIVSEVIFGGVLFSVNEYFEEIEILLTLTEENYQNMIDLNKRYTSFRVEKSSENSKEEIKEILSLLEESKRFDITKLHPISLYLKLEDIEFFNVIVES